MAVSKCLVFFKYNAFPCCITSENLQHNCLNNWSICKKYIDLSQLTNSFPKIRFFQTKYQCIMQKAKSKWEQPGRFTQNITEIVQKKMDRVPVLKINLHNLCNFHSKSSVSLSGVRLIKYPQVWETWEITEASMKSYKEITWDVSYYWASVFKSPCSHCHTLCKYYDELVHKC